jgi:hypothetical protein
MNQVRVVDRHGTALLSLDGMRGEPAEVAQRALDTLMNVAPPRRGIGALNVQVTADGQVTTFAVRTRYVAELMG